MKSLILVFFVFCSTFAFAQTAPPNIDVGSPNGSSEVMLLSGTDSATGAQHLLIGAKTPYPHIGHYYSADSGATWSGSSTIPDTLCNET